MLTDESDIGTATDLMDKLADADEYSCSIRLSPTVDPDDTSTFSNACELIASIRLSISALIPTEDP